VKRAVIIAVLASVLGGLAITGLTLGLTGSAHAAPAHPAASPTRVVIFDCPGQHALVRPRSFVLTCADGNAYFDKLSWTSWTPGLASARWC